MRSEFEAETLARAVKELQLLYIISNVTVDALSRKSIGSLAHIAVEKRPIVSK